MEPVGVGAAARIAFLAFLVQRERLPLLAVG